MNKKLHKAILGALGTAALTGLSSQAMATNLGGDLTSYIGNSAGYTTTSVQAAPAYVYDGGNIGYGLGGKGDCVTNDCGNLPVAGRARVGGANPMSGSVEGDRNLGWNHNSNFFNFQITSAGGYTISMDRVSTNTGNQPAFSVWSTGNSAWDMSGKSHSFNQVAAPGPTTSVANGTSAMNYYGPGITSDHYMVDYNGSGNGVTGFVGYANSGSTYTNSEGFLVKGALAAGTSVEGAKVGTTYQSIVTKGAYVDPHAGDVAAPYRGVGWAVNTSNPTLSNAAGGGHADLMLWLEPGWYTMTGGGSCADFTCTPTAVTNSTYTFKILTNSGVTAPSTVPVPAAVWLFGSALAGMGIIGRRKQQPA